jgi:serine/threonine protein phosphatase PrpC
MIQRIQILYTHHHWAKLAAFVAIVVCGALLYLCSGGFPPWAWRFLAQTLPLLPLLLKTQGSAIFAPLVGLLLLSLALLILWISLSIAAIRVGVQWWQDFHSHQSFASDLQEAEELAEAVTSLESVQQLNQSTLLSQDEVLQPVPSHKATYALGYSENAEQVSNIPLRAAAPAYPRLVPSQQPVNRVYAAPARSAIRDQLRIVPPVSEPRRASAYPARAYRPSIDIEKYDTVPPHTDLLDDSAELAQSFDLPTEAELQAILRTHRPESKKLAERRASEELKHTDYLTEDLADDEALLNAVQPGDTQLRLVVGVGLDPGLVRKNAPNEDTLLAIQGTRVTEHGAEPIGLFVVADGMGGHANGQEASRVAIQAMSDIIVPVIMRGTDGDDDFLQLLKEGAHRANLALYQRNRQQSHMMGTTLTAAIVAASTAYVVNVGDSRTYLYHKGAELSPITRDHSIVARMVESGAITRDEVYTHPKRNQIYRCLGEKASVEADTFVKELHCGDVLLLCSDGLWEMVRDGDMQKIIESSASHPSQTSSMLIQAALSRGGADNVSVVVVHMARAESTC